LKLEGALEIGRIADLWPSLRDRCAGIASIDLSAVTELDSSGVAMIRCLQALAERGGRRPEVLSAPARLTQIGLAHRVDAGGD
jgi:ABC-type transporter Mla MlaB component